METKLRCAWCEKDDLYRKYHDEEWGVPIYDDATIFEFLILETFQAGLSWHTILKKRENFRLALDNFDYKKIAEYSEDKVQEDFGSFSKYMWEFTNRKPIINYPKTLKDVPATTTLSDTISKDLKKRGFKFVGSTVIYTHMEATGMVNDHLEDCWRTIH